MKTPTDRFFCLFTALYTFLLMHNRAATLLAYSNGSDSIGMNRPILIMAMHPGFLRAGWQTNILSLEASWEWPAVSVSSTGGTTGTSTEHCNFAISI
jgi:hypothetical protein